MKVYEVIGEGGDCPKCLIPMQRREHKGEAFVKPKQKYYFAEWDYCLQCGHLQHYEIYKRFKSTYSLQ